MYIFFPNVVEQERTLCLRERQSKAAIVGLSLFNWFFHGERKKAKTEQIKSPCQGGQTEISVNIKHFYIASFLRLQ